MSKSSPKEFPESFAACFLIAVVLLRYCQEPDGPKVGFVEIVTNEDGSRRVVPFCPKDKKE